MCNGYGLNAITADDVWLRGDENTLLTINERFERNKDRKKPHGGFCR